MNFPFEIGSENYRVSAHLIFETFAFIIGFRYFVYLRKQQTDPIPESKRVYIIIAAAFGAFFFSRLIGSLEDPKGWAGSAHPWLYFYSSKTIVGGLLGGLIAVETIKLFLKERASSGDLFTYPLILAMIIGRIGCFTSGVHEPTYGIQSSLPWAMNLGDDILRHPVSLYEIAFLIFLWTALKALENDKAFAMGFRFKLFMITYLLFRFLLDFIKPVHFIVPSLSMIQITCLAGLIYYYRTITFIFIDRTKLHER